MLPPAHIAAGYLVAQAVLHIGHPNFSLAQTRELLFLGAFFGFAPDLDTFYTFFQVKNWIVHDDDPSHRKYVSHAPVVWLVAGLLTYFFARSTFVQYIGLLLWLCSWSHFMLDTVQSGIMWGWPFSNKIYAFTDKEIKSHIKEKRFFRFWWDFIEFYATRMWLSFYIELALVCTALIILFR